MRKIEQQMKNALDAKKPWKSGNTEVKDTGEGFGVFLQGNLIVTATESGYEVNERVLGRYPTRTTISRLRALGIDVRTKNYEVLLYGKPL